MQQATSNCLSNRRIWDSNLGPQMWYTFKSLDQHVSYCTPFLIVVCGRLKNTITKCGLSAYRYRHHKFHCLIAVTSKPKKNLPIQSREYWESVSIAYQYISQCHFLRCWCDSSANHISWMVVTNSHSLYNVFHCLRNKRQSLGARRPPFESSPW